MDILDCRGRRTPPPTRVLLVGAGAVGTVYGYHLARAGAHVAYLVRAPRVEATRAGLVLYELRGKRRRNRRQFVPGAVHGSVAEAAACEYDQLWLCLSTAALERALEADLPRLLRMHQGLVVTLQPGLHVPELLSDHVSADRLIDGGISMVAYQAPLVSGEVPEPGIAYWLPFPSPFTGPGAEGLVSLLRTGGCPAAVRPHTRAMMAYGTATLNPLIVALQGAGWKLAQLRKGRWADLGAAACAQARAVTDAQVEVPPPVGLHLVRGSMLRLAARLLPGLVPFELEVYLRYHFTKVSDQTRILMRRFIADGRALGLPIDAIEELFAATFERSVPRG